MTDVAIVAAARTPVGSFNGSFANLPAHELGKVAIKEVLKRAKVEAKEVSEVILGQILTAAQGQNPARQASINSGIPVEVPAWGVNQLCGSGLRAVALGHQAIVNGDSTVVVAGESTSGCVRATVVDGKSYRYKVIVPEQCVFDRHEATHAMNLFDMDQKYAEVVPVDAVIEYLRSVTRAGAAA